VKVHDQNWLKKKRPRKKTRGPGWANPAFLY
jgi:hypothetical protein